MTDPRTAAPLPADVVSHVRHDLRTFANHILGYSDMLLEVARDDGIAELVPGLDEVHALGGTLLEQIGTTLAPSRTDVTLVDYRRLADQLHPLIESLHDGTKKLLEQAQQLGREEEENDLHKILTATLNLRNFVAERLLEGLPANEPPPVHCQPAAPPSEEAAPDTPIETGHGRILIVDDVENNRDMLQRRLQRQGYTVVQATNGREALARIAQGNLDLVLLDILMPEVDGFEVLRQVKSTPSGRDLPIIMISSLDEIQSVVRCIEMGAEDFLPKPFDPVLLRARVGACLEKKRLRDQELDYLRQVATVTKAAGTVEAGTFDPDSLLEVAQRADELGKLARVFQQMGREVQAREQRLQKQVLQLKIEIDESRKKKQVAEVTETEYFQELQQRARDLRKRSKKPTSEA